MNASVPIFLDLVLIGRCLGALLWGVVLALFLQHTRRGQYLAAQRTWITVVLGVGLDLLISFGGDWYTVVLVIIASSVPIIARSLVNEQEQNHLNARSYKLVWGLEDTLALVDDLKTAVQKLLERGKLQQEDLRQVAHIVDLTHRINEKVKSARKGEYAQ